MKHYIAGLSLLLASACAPLSQSPTTEIVSSDLVSTDDIHSDFKILYETLQGSHIDLFANRSKAEYDRYYNSMRAAFSEPMAPKDVQVAFQKFTAYGKVAHARIEFPGGAYNAFRDSGGKSFPVFLRIADGRAYVEDNLSSVTALKAGMEITHLDAVPMDEWLERVSSHISADTPGIAHSILEFSFPAYLWLEIGEQDGMQVTYNAGPNDRRTDYIAFRSRTAQQEAQSDDSGVFTVNGFERDAKILDQGFAYLKPGPFFNIADTDNPWDVSEFEAFIDTAFKRFIDENCDTLIIDLRNNPGGDNSFSDPMLAWFADRPFRFASEFVVRSSEAAQSANQKRLGARPSDPESVSARYAKHFESTPFGDTFEFEISKASPRDGEQFEGEIYVLINRHSYSNAVNTASIVQDYGFGVIAGEPTTDFATTFGAMETFTLPKTGISVGFPKAHITRPNGDPTPGEVSPDWLIKSPIIPVKTDVVLAQLAEKIQASR